MNKFEMAVNIYKKYLITEALKANGFNQCKAARALGLHRNTIYRYMQDFGIPTTAELLATTAPNMPSLESLPSIYRAGAH